MAFTFFLDRCYVVIGKHSFKLLINRPSCQNSLYYLWITVQLVHFSRKQLQILSLNVSIQTVPSVSILPCLQTAEVRRVIF